MESPNDGPVQELLIVNSATGNRLSVANGRVATIPIENRDNHEPIKDLADAGKAGQGLHAFIGVSDEAVQASDASRIPTTEWTVTPKKDNAEVFHIVHAETGTCLKDAGTGSDTEPIPVVTDTLPRDDSPESQGSHLWQLVSLTARGPIAAAANLTPIDDKSLNSFARPAMELLISQWVDNSIVYTSANPIRTVASIDSADIKKLEKDGYKLKQKDKDALLNGGVRVDRQGFIQRNNKGPYFANMQGQVAKKSVWQVNVETGYNFGASKIRTNYTSSMNGKPPQEIWLSR
ncbi:hypothetical protein BDV25DRAFT_80774 [Aspergillus avenaceus]|uniref:Uncharacterized protein n=1 Tax=Aspergillus avenaceus TaxID=36643 RepID=A0A5N6U069_ASPAV|nr:hypothetical protein BDV25DRAFT_80774 [Aspergillus avenaceus]